ncbi:uncharacterized protein [Triticum aestivum]|uniref:uncharacterized protein n=1 Tax=Triticum aestivum TaxID=4565 RepID=UPI001D018FAA|nr:uncharacterized protein LOC123174941 [Triticum aestivum]
MNAALDAAGVARRRSPRLHPQVQANEEGAGLNLRRSARLHPPVHASDEGDGVTRRRSPRLHPQVQGVARRRSTRLRPKVHATEEASGVIRSSRRRRHSSPAALASPLEDDDLLREILLRLPPQTSSLPRASAVCKRWRHATTDPRFHRQFRAYHQKPPLLGFFEDSLDGIVFRPILDHPVVSLHSASTCDPTALTVATSRGSVCLGAATVAFSSCARRSRILLSLPP